MTVLCFPNQQAWPVGVTDVSIQAWMHLSECGRTSLSSSTFTAPFLWTADWSHHFNHKWDPGLYLSYPIFLKHIVYTISISLKINPNRSKIGTLNNRKLDLHRFFCTCFTSAECENFHFFSFFFLFNCECSSSRTHMQRSRWELCEVKKIELMTTC